MLRASLHYVVVILHCSTRITQSSYGTSFTEVNYLVSILHSARYFLITDGSNGKKTIRPTALYSLSCKNLGGARTVFMKWNWNHFCLVMKTSCSVILRGRKLWLIVGWRQFWDPQSMLRVFKVRMCHQKSATLAGGPETCLHV